MRKGTCIHYDGMIPQETCNAGVNYKLTFGNQPGVMLRAPCIQYRVVPAHGRGTAIRPGDEVVRQEIDRHGQEMIRCNLFQEPTDEQVEEFNKKQDEAFSKAVAGVKTAMAWKVNPKPDADRHEIVECPVCHGKLHLYQSAFNGHCSAKCETDGCVKFME